MSPDPDIPEWERLLAAERHLQAILPSAVLVGGTAAALHVHHRVSLDGDHVLADLRDHFDDVLATLEAVAGWETARIRPPVLILGRLDGIETGIRQLRRTVPLETEIVEDLRVPTVAEMARIKAWLLVTRHTVRDYLDTVVLLERLGEDGACRALRSLDEVYRQPNGASPLVELVERLAAGAPSDAAAVDLASYRRLVPPWNDWAHVASRGRSWARVLAPLPLQGQAMTISSLRGSRALWNRSELNLDSDETLAQLLERGELEAWRELYRLAIDDPRLRGRILRIIDRVPLPFPRFWRAAIASLGESVDVGAPVPHDDLDGE